MLNSTFVNDGETETYGIHHWLYLNYTNYPHLHARMCQHKINKQNRYELAPLEVNF